MRRCRQRNRDRSRLDRPRWPRAHRHHEPHGARAQHLARPWRRAPPRALPGNRACRRRRAFASSGRTSARFCAISRPPIPSRSTAPSGRARWRCCRAFPSRRPGSARIASDKPAFVWARLGGSLTIIGTHLNRPSRDPWLHERQMAALAQFVRRIDGPLVLAGDLNTSPWSNAFRKLRVGNGALARRDADAELAGLAAGPAAGGARSHFRLAGPCRGGRRHRARRRLRPSAGVGAARAPAALLIRDATRAAHALQRRERISAASSLLTSAANMVAREICAGDRSLPAHAASWARCRPRGGPAPAPRR